MSSYHQTSALRVRRCFLACDVLLDDSLITFINVHIPNVRSHPAEFQQLLKFTSARFASRLVIAVDFNAHIGRSDLTHSDKQYIGENLYHEYCNENGLDLKKLIHGGGFSVKNTWATNASLRFTWSNSCSKSQIDHVLCNTDILCFRSMYKIWVPTVHTDHKLLSTTIMVNPGEPISAAS